MIAEGWISNEEMELVHYHMRRKGSILEVGCAVGKLFSYLYSFHPNWKYTVVDPFEEELVYLQKDWNKGYFDEDNLGELVTRKLFEKNCPFAHVNQCYFENFETDEKFDIVSLGLVGSKVDYIECYKKAKKLLNPNGLIIGRNYNHKKYGDVIKEAIDCIGGSIIDTAKGSFVLNV